MALFSRQTRSGGASSLQTIDNCIEFAGFCLHEIADGPRMRAGGESEGRLLFSVSASNWLIGTAKIPPYPYGRLDRPLSECFESFASISNRVPVIRISPLFLCAP